MSNITIVDANQDIDGTTAYEHTFEPRVLHEILLKFHPKKLGVPICHLGGNGQETIELHGKAMRSRPGIFKVRIKGDRAFSTVRVTVARNKESHLEKIKLVGKVA